MRIRGGRVSGSFSTDTTEIFQEGLQLRSVKVYKRGKPDEEILRIIRHNIRFPELSLGDMAAQVAASRRRVNSGTFAAAHAALWPATASARTLFRHFRYCGMATIRNSALPTMSAMPDGKTNRKADTINTVRWTAFSCPYR